MHTEKDHDTSVPLSSAAGEAEFSGRRAEPAGLCGELCVDFTEPGFRRRCRRSGEELLVRAARIRSRQNALLIDAAAGLGRDGFLLAAAGFRVRMFERHPLTASLLREGLSQAALHPDTAAIAARIRLTEGDALEYLPFLEEAPEVIYLDPMFPARSKSAQVKRAARFLRSLHEEEENREMEQRLLASALQLQPRKVVVKRPLKGGMPPGRPPSYTLKGRAVRFDVYVK